MFYLLLFVDVTDPVGDVTRFIAAYNERYGPEHPVFYQGSYSQVNIICDPWYEKEPYWNSSMK